MNQIFTEHVRYWVTEQQSSPVMSGKPAESLSGTNSFCARSPWKLPSWDAFGELGHYSWSQPWSSLPKAAVFLPSQSRQVALSLLIRRSVAIRLQKSGEHRHWLPLFSFLVCLFIWVVGEYELDSPLRLWVPTGHDYRRVAKPSVPVSGPLTLISLINTEDNTLGPPLCIWSPPSLFVGHSLTFLPSIGHELSSSLEQTSVSADVVSSQVLPHSSPNSPLQNCLETHPVPAVPAAWI